MKTLLERAKGSLLSIFASIDPIGVIKLLPPYTKQFVDLKFTNNRWTDIRRFTKINSGPLPFLRTLNTDAVRGIGPDDPGVYTTS